MEWATEGTAQNLLNLWFPHCCLLWLAPPSEVLSECCWSQGALKKPNLAAKCQVKPPKAKAVASGVWSNVSTNQSRSSPNLIWCVEVCWETTAIPRCKMTWLMVSQLLIHIYLPTYLSTLPTLSLHLSMYPSIHLSTYLSIFLIYLLWPCISPSIHVSIYQSTCLSVHLSKVPI